MVVLITDYSSGMTILAEVDMTSYGESSYGFSSYGNPPVTRSISLKWNVNKKVIPSVPQQPTISLIDQRPQTPTIAEIDLRGQQ